MRMGALPPYRVAQDARDAGVLKIRMYNHIGGPDLDKMIAGRCAYRFRGRVGASRRREVYADGSISERTAWLSQPYEDMPEFRGLQDDLAGRSLQLGSQAQLAGWQIGVHANGDLAIDRVLSVFERLQKESPRRDPRFRIEHCTLLNADLIRRIKAVGAIPDSVAGYVYFHGDVMHFYGEERTRHIFAMRELIDAGIRPPLSSDYTASPSDPVMWLQSLVTRTDYQGHTWVPTNVSRSKKPSAPAHWMAPRPPMKSTSKAPSSPASSPISWCGIRICSKPTRRSW